MMARSEQAQRMLRAGIVGCGQVAEYHASFVSALPGASLVSVVDVDEARARDFAGRYRISGVFTSLDAMLDAAALDVVHIVTPPNLHVSQALTAVNAGVHVLVEKPVGLKRADVEGLFKRARERGVLVCPDFIHLFHSRLIQAKKLIGTGQLGRVLYCEVFLALDLNTELAEVRELRAPHWSFGLPGGVLPNYLTHAVYLAAVWVDNIKDVQVMPKVFGSLPQGLTDHIDIVVTGDTGMAHITLSLATRPCPYFVKVYCERGVAHVDIDRLTIVSEASSS